MTPKPLSDEELAVWRDEAKQLVASTEQYREKMRPVHVESQSELLCNRILALLATLDHIQTGVAEVYQAFALLADHSGLFGHPDVVPVMDWLADPSGPCDLLPWPKTPLPPDDRDATIARLRKALEPFAKISPSTLCSDSDNEGYVAALSARLTDDDESDFTRQDLIRARAALAPPSSTETEE